MKTAEPRAAIARTSLGNLVVDQSSLLCRLTRTSADPGVLEDRVNELLVITFGEIGEGCRV
jgi:hypothetical protein